MMRDTEKTFGNLIDKASLSQICSVDDEGYPFTKTSIYFVNKRCWNSIFLDGILKDDMLREQCDILYLLVFGKLTKRLQLEITTVEVKS